MAELLKDASFQITEREQGKIVIGPINGKFYRRVANSTWEQLIYSPVPRVIGNQVFMAGSYWGQLADMSSDDLNAYLPKDG